MIPNATIRIIIKRFFILSVSLSAFLMAEYLTFCQPVQIIITASVAVGTRTIRSCAAIEKIKTIAEHRIPVTRVAPYETVSPPIIPSHTGQTTALKPLKVSERRIVALRFSLRRVWVK